jgi:hypothetical protein
MDSVQDTLARGFPHSEILGSKLVCQLPEAYRRLLRLSSPVAAKASTICAYSLDHITPKRRSHTALGFSPMQHSQTDALRINPRCEDMRDICMSSALTITSFRIVKERSASRRRQKAAQASCLRCFLATYRKLVEPAGIEPATPSLQSWCSPS